MQGISVHIKGVAPLLMRCGRLADPLDEFAIELGRLTSKRMKTRADHERIARLEWHGGLWLSDGLPCLPPDAVERCIAEAAATRRLGKMARAGLVCTGPAILEYPGPRDLEALWEDAAYRLRRGVCVRGARIIRTRPRFPTWEARIDLEVLPSMVDPSVIRDLVAIAGFRIGIGDFRPRYGRFRLRSG